MKQIIYSSPMDLDLEIIEGLSKGEKVFVIDFFAMCHNPHDCLAGHDLLKAYAEREGAEFHFRYRGLSNIFTLAMGAVAKKRWINKNASIFIHNVSMLGYGSASDLKRAAQHNEDLCEIIANIVSEAYGVDIEELNKLIDRGGFIHAQDMADWDIQIIENILDTTPQGPFSIDDDDDEDDLPKQRGAIDAEEE